LAARHDFAATGSGGRKHAVVGELVHARGRDKGGQTLDEDQGIEDEMGCAVFEGSAQLMHDLALLGERKPQGGEGRARDVATEMLQTRTVPSLDLDGGVQTEAVELGTQFLEFWSPATVVCGWLSQA
jgi:hypothetical protein